MTDDGKATADAQFDRIIEADLEKAQNAWEKAVLVAHQHRCGNCGNEDRLCVHMVVPAAGGGQLIESNGTVLCRACEMTRDAIARHAPASEQRPINFWVSRRIHNRINDSLRPRNGTKSLAGLVKYLMNMYVKDPERFDDLERYQDSERDVKINVWVDGERYGLFKKLLDERNMTVTDAVKALLQVYDEETIILECTGKERVRTSDAATPEAPQAQE